uniref:Uncharacterized protein n=1 Tax=Arundo donax TaxID=35708 RepID=A0A0A9G7C7_ARUDO
MMKPRKHSNKKQKTKVVQQFQLKQHNPLQHSPWVLQVTKQSRAGQH